MVNRCHSFHGRFKFKALELNKKILKGAEVLKKPAAKEPTVPEGFELQIEKRLQGRQSAKPQEADEKPHAFKSQPLPKNILEGVVVSSVLAAVKGTCEACLRTRRDHRRFVWTGVTGEEGSTSHRPRIPGLRPQEEDPPGAQD